jgi:hypothetical protein
VLGSDWWFGLLGEKAPPEEGKEEEEEEEEEEGTEPLAKEALYFSR